MIFGRFAQCVKSFRRRLQKVPIYFSEGICLALSHVGISRDKWSSSEDIWKCKMKVLDCLCNAMSLQVDGGVPPIVE